MVIRLISDPTLSSSNFLRNMLLHDSLAKTIDASLNRWVQSSTYAVPQAIDVPAARLIYCRWLVCCFIHNCRNRSVVRLVRAWAQAQRFSPESAGSFHLQLFWFRCDWHWLPLTGSEIKVEHDIALINFSSAWMLAIVHFVSEQDICLWLGTKNEESVSNYMGRRASCSYCAASSHAGLPTVNLQQGCSLLSNPNGADFMRSIGFRDDQLLVEALMSDDLKRWCICSNNTLILDDQEEPL